MIVKGGRMLRAAKAMGVRSARHRSRKRTAPTADRSGGAAAADVPAPADLRVGKLRTRSREVLVLSYRLWSPAIPAALTIAEQHVLAGILAGQSNADIARLRRTSLRTVANQVA